MMATIPGKREKIITMFDAIAPNYDTLNHLLSFGTDRSWRRKTIRALAKDDPQDILDIATGTADLAISIAGNIKGCRVNALDPSEQMLHLAHRKIKDKGLDEVIELKQGEGECLPYADESFDAVTIAFGIRNFHDIERSLDEIYRVLRPGGRLYILEFSDPDNRLLRPFYRFYFHRLLPLVGGFVSGNYKAYKYLPVSVDGFPGKYEFLEIMASRGYHDLNVRRFMSGVACLFTASRIKN